jgi:hypothetical protein
MTGKKWALLFLFLILQVSVLRSDEITRLDLAGPSNLVMGVVGYKTVRILGPGIEIPLFSPTLEAGNGQESGILFCVVSPTNFAGRFFFLGRDKGCDMSSKLYKPNELYTFEFSEDGVCGISTNELFDIPPISQNGHRLIGHIGMFRYLTTPNEARLYICELEKLLKENEIAIIDAKEKVEKERQRLAIKPNEFVNTHKNIDYLKAVTHLNFLRQDGETIKRKKTQALTQLKNLQQTLP